MGKTGGKDKLANNCPYAGECGGCTYTGCGYLEQAMAKQKMMESLLPKSCDVKPIITCDNPFHYRNKVHSAYKRLKLLYGDECSFDIESTPGESTSIKMSIPRKAEIDDETIL